LISAGEASGELYGAGLIEALRRRAPDADFFGVGGERMRSVGFETTVDAQAISVVGLAEVVTHLPRIYGEFRRVVREAKARRPDAAILIDFPDFNLRLARKLHKLGVPVIYYVSPQLWAWRSGRIAQIKKYVRKMLVIFPFEVEFYRKHGVEAEYVGHPLAEQPLPSISREQFAKENGLDASKIWVALLPGSRRKEVSLNLPAMLKAAATLGYHQQFVLPVANSLDPEWMRGLTAQSQIPITLTRDARASLLHARAAIVASGTATLETALTGTPFAMVYRVSPLTWLLGRRLVKVDRFAMPNLIAGRDVVPEFVQGEFRPEAVAEKMRELIADSPEREKMIADLKEVRAKLQMSGEGSAPAFLLSGERAAEAVMGVLGKR
jgi:lipid-A-disaccharide synthase